MASANNNNASYQCPVCGYDQMRESPDSGNICPCCGIEFDADDLNKTLVQLRGEWIENGFRWFSKGTLSPKDWNPYRQLILAKHGGDLLLNPRFPNDANYRNAVDESFSNIRMAKQLRVLRERHHPPLTQAQVAEKTEMKQSRISELENVDYSSWSVSTLRRFARAFGVRLVFGCAPWERLPLEMAQGLNIESLWVPPFDRNAPFSAPVGNALDQQSPFWKALRSSGQMSNEPFPSGEIGALRERPKPFADGGVFVGMLSRSQPTTETRAKL